MRTSFLLLTLGPVDISCLKQKRTGGRKKRHNADLIQQHHKKARSVTFWSLCVCIYMWILWKLCENPQQLPKMLTYTGQTSDLWLMWLRAVFSANVAILTARDPSLLGLSPQLPDFLTANSSTPCLRLKWPTSLVLATPTSHLGPSRRFTWVPVGTTLVHFWRPPHIYTHTRMHIM